MDPITLIVTALAAGAALGVKDSASSAVKDAYSALKGLARRKLAARRDGELVLERHEEAPDTWKAPLAEELKAVGADGDEALLEAARRLMDLADEAGARAGKYSVVVHNAQNVQVGDGNAQYNGYDPSRAAQPGPR